MAFLFCFSFPFLAQQLDGPAESASVRDLAIAGIPRLTDTESEKHDVDQRLIMRGATWSLYLQPLCLLLSIALGVSLKQLRAELKNS